MKFAALILAGGASRRMGRPKALLPFEGETFVDHLVGVFSAVCEDVVVVLGHRHDEIRRRLTRPARFVVNPDPERGQLSSMQCGLAEMPACDAFFFTPVDYPAITKESVRRLAAVMESDRSALLVIPQCDGKHGHPVGCQNELRAEFLALPVSGQAREVVKGHLGQTRYVDVEDRGTITDVDDPQAYERLLTGIRAV